METESRGRGGTFLQQHTELGLVFLLPFEANQPEELNLLPHGPICDTSSERMLASHPPIAIVIAIVSIWSPILLLSYLLCTFLFFWLRSSLVTSLMSLPSDEWQNDIYWQHQRTESYFLHRNLTNEAPQVVFCLFILLFFCFFFLPLKASILQAKKGIFFQRPLKAGTCYRILRFLGRQFLDKWVPPQIQG